MNVIHSCHEFYSQIQAEIVFFTSGSGVYQQTDTTGASPCVTIPQGLRVFFEVTAPSHHVTFKARSAIHLQLKPSTIYEYIVIYGYNSKTLL